jgi:hypothetical protein
MEFSMIGLGGVGMEGEGEDVDVGVEGAFVDV